MQEASLPPILPEPRLPAGAGRLQRALAAELGGMGEAQARRHAMARMRHGAATGMPRELLIHAAVAARLGGCVAEVAELQGAGDGEIDDVEGGCGQRVGA